MNKRPCLSLRILMVMILFFLFAPQGFAILVDTTGLNGSNLFRVDSSKENKLSFQWPCHTGQAEMHLSFEKDTALIQHIQIDGQKIIQKVHPEYIYRVGDRNLSSHKGWMIFFDRMARKNSVVEKAVLTPQKVKVEGSDTRVTLEIVGLNSDTFKGSLLLTFFSGSPLIKMEARVSTQRPATAFVYSFGLSKTNAKDLDVHYYDNFGMKHEKEVGGEASEILKTKYRALALAGEHGSVGIMPEPHRFLYPLDFVENYGFNWAGENHDKKIKSFSYGIRQPHIGDNRYTPWVNAPEGSLQTLGAFLVISNQGGEQNLELIKKYTRGDKLKPLPGHKTFTSHYHIEHTLDYMKQQKKEKTKGMPKGFEKPEFIDVFKETGIDIIHLAEFHVGKTPKLPLEKRVEELQLLHRECERLSDHEILLLPGEEPNVHLGGHWISFFPKPILWVLNRPKGTPFEQDIPDVGKVYSVGSAEDVQKLFEKENGLYWTAHPRIKGSTGYPDKYKGKDFYKSSHFLGAAWKAMPADYSRETMGWRVLDLLDDMNNWGQRKQILGEVDAFKIKKGYEFYGAINVNYLKLDKTPNFNESWEPILDALRGGSFFTTTGEILIHSCQFNGTDSGEVLKKDQEPIHLKAKVEGTFPLAFAYVFHGDGAQTYREKIDLTHTREFSIHDIQKSFDLSQSKWVRFEVWDIASNGAFTQPVWIE